MIPIKVSGIQSLTDARYCAGMNVSYLSVVFEEDGACKLSPTEFKAIEAWIEGVEWWGEYKGSNPAILSELSEAYGIRTWVTNCILEDPSVRLIGDGKENRDGMELSIMGDKESGLARLTGESKGIVILQNPENANEILELHKRYPGLIFNLLSGEEERPGWMDLSGLQDVLEAIEEAE